MIHVRRSFPAAALALLISVAFAPTILPAAAALAAEAQAADHHDAAAPHESAGHAASVHHHEPALSDLLFPAINFTIYFVIVVRFVIPAMREFLRRRRADFVQEESAASDALAHAEQELATKKARLAGMPSEAESIRQDLVAIAMRQGQRLTAQAEESGARRVADAALLAEQERRRALGEVRADLAREAAGLAEQRIRSALTPDDQRMFVQQFLKDATTR